MNSGIAVYSSCIAFPCTISLVVLWVVNQEERQREKSKKNRYKSLSAMSSTTISSLHIQNDDNGRRSGVHTLNLH